MTDEDGFRIEAAEQFGFTPTDPDAERYECTEAQLIAFAKACERKGLCTARSHVRQELNNPLSARDKSPLKTIIGRLSKQITEIDTVNNPILEAERSKIRTQVSDSECCDLAAAEPCADCPFPETAREPCHYCGPGKLTGLPGNACENCMNTGFANPTAEDLA